MIKTILLADDSITMQKVIRLTFASGGYELHCADNGDEALKKAEELKPHIVLVDAALPGLNGYEVCEAIKNNPDLKDTPVIILAGTFNPLDDKKALKAQADDSIVKPFESRQLTEKVESLFKKFPPGETSPSEDTITNDRPDWAEDDVIRAPEPTPAVEPPLSSSADLVEDTIDATSEIPDLDIMEGRGIIEETPGSEEASTSLSIPEMKTADGESEGESGFDIEGFEINPFKSEPLRETSPLGETDKGLKAWNVDEKDLIAFNDLETETEIEVETRQPFADGDTGEKTIEEPTDESIEVEEETSEPTDESIEAEEETSEPTDESIEAEAETSEPTDESIEAEAETSEPTDESIEAEEETAEPVEDTVEAEAETAEATDETIEAEEETSEPFEESIEEEHVDTEPASIPEDKTEVEECLETSDEDEAGEEITDQPSEEWIRELVRKTTHEAIEEVVSDSAPGLIKEAIEEVVRDIVPGLMKEAIEDEMERIKKAIRGL